MHFAGLSCDEYEADPGNERAVNQALEQTITGAVPNSSSSHTCRAASSSSSSRRKLFTSDEIGLSVSLTVRDAAFGGTTSKANITNKARDSFAELAASGDLIRAIVENAPAGSSLLFASIYPHAPPTSSPTPNPTGERLTLKDSLGIPRHWESSANYFLGFTSVFTFGFATFVFASKKDENDGLSEVTFAAVAKVAFAAVVKHYAEILTITFGVMDLISDFLFAVQCIYWSFEPNLENDEGEEDYYIAPAMSAVGYFALGWVLVCMFMNAIFIYQLSGEWDRDKMEEEGMYKYGAVVLLMGFGLDAMTMLPWKETRRHGYDNYPEGSGVFFSLISKVVEDIPQFIFQGIAMVILSSNPITQEHAFSSV